MLTSGLDYKDLNPEKSSLTTDEGMFLIWLND